MSGVMDTNRFAALLTLRPFSGSSLMKTLAFCHKHCTVKAAYALPSKRFPFDKSGESGSKWGELLAWGRCDSETVWVSPDRTFSLCGPSRAARTTWCLSGSSGPSFSRPAPCKPQNPASAGSLTMYLAVTKSSLLFAARGVAAVEAHADSPVPGPWRRWGLCSLSCAR